MWLVYRGFGNPLDGIKAFLEDVLVTRNEIQFLPLSQPIESIPLRAAIVPPECFDRCTMSSSVQFIDQVAIVYGASFGILDFFV